MGKVIRKKLMDKLQIKANVRDIKTTTPKKLRKAGLTPAVLYGYKVENQALTVPTGEFEKLLRKAGESTIVELVTDDGKTHSVLIHDVQYHYLYSTIEHVDFYTVNMAEKLTATVALEFTGESNAVKALGGTLVKIMSEVEVECLPTDLPHNIVVDISTLSTFEDVITVKNLTIPAKVTIITDAEEVVAKVQPPRDMEKEMESQLGDISQVEGAAEEKPAAEGDTEKVAETKE